MQFFKRRNRCEPTGFAQWPNKPKEVVMPRNLVITKEYVTVADTRMMVVNTADMDAWKARWPNVMPWEIDTRDFSVRMATRALDAWQAMRDEWGRGLYITNGCRNWAHNTAVGGKANSDHLTEDENGKPLNATAFDIGVSDSAMGRKLEALAIKHGFNAIGRYSKSRFIHVSIRKPKPNGKIYSWGSWYAPKKVKHV